MCIWCGQMMNQSRVTARIYSQGETVYILFVWNSRLCRETQYPTSLLSVSNVYYLLYTTFIFTMTKSRKWSCDDQRHWSDDLWYRSSLQISMHEISHRIHDFIELHASRSSRRPTV